MDTTDYERKVTFMKKLLGSKVLSVLLCLSMTVPVFGAQADPVQTSLDEGIITCEETTGEDTADEDISTPDAEVWSESYYDDPCADCLEAEGADDYHCPEYVSEEDIERFKADGTWDEKVAMMDQLTEQQEELQRSLIGNLAKYDPRNSGDLSADGAQAPIGQRQPVTGIPPVMPAEGEVSPIVFTAEFEDYKMPDQFMDKMEKRLFSADTSFKNYPYDSLRSYYYKASGGKLTLSGDMFSYCSKKNRSDYDSDDPWNRNHDLYGEIFVSWMDYLTAIGKKDNYSLEDMLSLYDSDNDKVIDGIYIMYAGPQGEWATQWWSYRTNFNYKFGNTDYYCKQLVFLNTHSYNVDACIRTFIHETGHMLGLADYYPYKAPKVNKMTTFDMMNNNLGEHNGFSKMLLGWLPEKKVKFYFSDSEVTLNPYGGADGDIAIILPKDEYNTYGIYSEFFMAEYYQPVGLDNIPKGYRTKNGLRLFHVYARLNDSKTAFIADNRYNQNIPLISCMDKDYDGHTKNSYYSNCLYYKGNEFGPWTAPGSSFYDDWSNSGKYTASDLKYTGIYINNIDPGDESCKFDLCFVSYNSIKNTPAYREKAAVKPEYFYMSNANTYGYRRFAIRLNQEVSVILGKKIQVYDLLEKRVITTIDSKDIRLIPNGQSWCLSRRNAYIYLNDKYISNRNVKIIIPKGTFKGTCDYVNQPFFKIFNYASQQTNMHPDMKGSIKAAALPPVSDHLDDYDVSYSWDGALDKEGSGLVALMQPEDGRQKLEIYKSKYGEFTGSEVRLRPDCLNNYDDYDAKIVKLCSLGDDRYLMVIGGLTVPMPYDEETPYDESTYYALITLKPGTGAIESERVIKMEDSSCAGIVDGKFAVAYPVEGSDTKQTMKLYDPLSESSDVTYEINAGLSNEDVFMGGGDGTIKKVGDNIAIAPDGYSWIILTPADSSTITGYKYFTDDKGAIPTAIEYYNGRYYVATNSDDNMDTEEYNDDLQYGCQLSVYASLDSKAPENSTYLYGGVDELCVSDEGVLVYQKDLGGTIFDIDLSISEDLYDLSIHNAFATVDGGFFVTVDASPEIPYEETEDIYEPDKDDDYEVEEDELQIWMLYPPYDLEFEITPPVITTVNPSMGTVGSEYYTYLEADSADAVEWTISGNELPQGLTLDKDSGEITGIPVKEEQVTVTVCASNKMGTDSKELTFIIEKEPTYVTINGIPAYVEYTGKKITFPECEVSYKGRTLKAGSEYSIKYEKNTACGEALAKVTLKKPLSGELEQKFIIYPADIGNDEFKAEDIFVNYKAGKTFKPSPVLKWNGKKLKAGTDYTVSGDEPRTQAGEYTITLKGKNNFEGERQLTFCVTNGILMNEASVKKIADKSYTGKEIRPGSEIEVTYKGEKVDKQAYSVSYENNIYPGKATVIIKGSGKTVAGIAFEGTKTVEFNIEGKSLAVALKSLRIPDQEYTGSVIKPVTDELLAELSIYLQEGTDYELKYLNNTGTGRAAAVFTGINGYTGTVMIPFAIKKYKLHDNDTRVTLSVNRAEYSKGGATVKPLVMLDDYVLKEGVDYKLSFASNKKSGQNGIVTVKGTGSFSGSIKAYFGIDKKALNKTTCFAEDVKYTEGKNAGSYLKKPVLTDTDGKKLSAGRDYSRDYIYRYANDTVLSGGQTVSAGSIVKPDDIPPAGTAISVTVTAAGDNYSGDTQTVYRIVDKLIKSSKFTIDKDKVFYYSGEQIRPVLEDIKCDDPAVSYVIIGYGTNITPGKGSVIVQGTGSYGGTKEVKFVIKNRDIKNSNRGIAE